MIIIAGAGQPKIESYLSLKLEHCNNCNNDRKWILQKTSYYVTLFFLPVVPYKKKFTFSCPICNYTRFLDNETFTFKSKFEAEPTNNK